MSTTAESAGNPRSLTGRLVIADKNAPTALAAEIVRTFGAVHLRVLGTSMAPSILHGDVISVERARLEEISCGEIVLFSRCGRMFVHRVVSPSSTSGMPRLITRGDRLTDNDPPVLPSELLGRVVSIERGSRQFKPQANANRPKRLVTRILRGSEFATRAYLRFVAWTRKLNPAEAECRSLR